MATTSFVKLIHMHPAIYLVLFMLVLNIQVVSDSGTKWRILETYNKDTVAGCHLVRKRLLLRCQPDTIGRPSAMMWLTGYVMAAIVARFL